MKFLVTLLLGALVGLGVALGGLIWRAQTYGAGPVVTGAAPQGSTRDIAFVANAVGGTVTLIDLGALEVIGEIDVIPDGARVGYLRDFNQARIGQASIEATGGLNYAQDVDLSPDGRVLYVARGHLGDVAAFDIASGALMWRTPVAGWRADHMAISPDGSRLYVSALTAARVEVIDTASGRKVGSFPTGARPHDNHVTHDGARLFNAAIAPNTDEIGATEPGTFQVTLVDADTLEQIDAWGIYNAVRPFQLAPDETSFYAQLSEEHAVVEYDLAAREIARRLDLPIDEGVTEDDYDFAAPHHGLDLTSDGALLCAAGRASDYVALIDVATFQPLAFIDTGDAPSWASIDDDDRYCLVANNRSDDVSVISLAEGREVIRLPGGRGPKQIETGRVPAAVLAGY